MCRVSFGGLGNITSARGVGEGESSEDLKIIIIQNLVSLMRGTRKFRVPHEGHGILPQNSLVPHEGPKKMIPINQTGGGHLKT